MKNFTTWLLTTSIILGLTIITGSCRHRDKDKIGKGVDLIEYCSKRDFTAGSTTSGEDPCIKLKKDKKAPLVKEPGAK